MHASLVVSLAAVGDAVIMVTLWAAVIAGRCPRAARMPLALMAFGCAWGLSFVVMRLRYPAWTIPAAVFAILISVLLIIAAAQLSLPRDSGGGGADDAGGDGGTRPPDRPIDGGGPAEPGWWPEFERDLARYTEERKRAEREALVGR